MFKNKKIKFYSSKIVNDQTIEDSYLKAVVSKKNELQVELEEEIKKIQQPIQQDIQDINEHIQQLNKRIRDYNSILEQLPTPEKVVSEIGLSKEENNIIEAPAVQTDIDKNSQEKSSTLLQSIREKKLKPLQPRNETGETNLAAINNVDDYPKKFAVDVNILSRVKLKKTVQTRDVISNNENRINPELAEKLTKQRALLDKSNPINIEHTEKSEEKFSNPAAVEVQVQKNIDNIAAPDQTQNFDRMSFLFQQLQVGKQKLKKSDYLDNLNQKKYFQKATQLLEGLRDYLKEEDFENYEFDLSEKYSTSQLDEQTLQSLKILARSLKGLSKISEQNEDIDEDKDEDENKVALTALDKLLQSIQKEIAFLDRSKRASGHEPKIVEMTFKPRR